MVRRPLDGGTGWVWPTLPLDGPDFPVDLVPEVLAEAAVKLGRHFVVVRLFVPGRRHAAGPALGDPVSRQHLPAQFVAALLGVRLRQHQAILADDDGGVSCQLALSTLPVPHG